VAEDESHQRLITVLNEQLQQSRQQQTRLRDALTTLLSLVEQDKNSAVP